MTQRAYLFAHCGDAVCVAEDTAVGFYAAKTLKKFRVETFRGARICGVHIQRTTRGNVLHVIDAEWNWFVVSLKHITMEYSTRLDMESEGVAVAQFFEVDDSLHAIVLDNQSVLRDVCLSSGAHDFSTDSQPSIKSESATCWKGDAFGDEPGAILWSVGRRSGLVVASVLGSQELWYSHYEDRYSSESAAPLPPRNRTQRIRFAAHSVACSPVGSRVAVGGGRGELAVYQEMGTNHHFSDHWHHTPLEALSFSVDGSTLLTGAHEEVLLVWNMSSFRYKKIQGMGLGPIRSIVSSVSVGSTFLVASSFSTLSTVDLLQLTVEQTVQGIEWASNGTCNGFFFTQWMGQHLAVLTGLPNVLRLTDPMSQQAVYSLHTSSQLETLSVPPRHGIEFAAVLKEGKTIITYEVFDRTVLPPQLCFWSYDMATRRHTLSQTVYSPHDDDITALQVDMDHHRLFTLSKEMMKCWEEVLEDPNDVFQASVEGRAWRNQSASRTPTPDVTSLVLSCDGSLCGVADDTVHLYNVQRCFPGMPWTRVRTLSQGLTRDTLVDLEIFDQGVLGARTAGYIFVWSLMTPEMQVHNATVSPFTAMCRYDKDGLLVAEQCGAMTLLRVDFSVAPLTLHIQRRIDAATPHPVFCLRQVPDHDGYIAVMDRISGFRVRRLHEDRSAEVEWKGENTGAEVGAEEATRSFSHSFQPIAVTPFAEQGDEDGATRQSSWTASGNHAAYWLTSVLQESAYTAPPMSAVFLQYLQQRDGCHYLLAGHSTA